ncbi:Ionotropic receptor 93a [Eumeta japonica]|uniref:Ionotropic receptor 93a n=1 Tax=Eumeta variegata TaxID=151549 RepID=A0A4C1VA55_EUMVA|nr:Ionotropic receptor 93a [Eumeta japonica]
MNRTGAASSPHRCRIGALCFVTIKRTRVSRRCGSGSMNKRPKESRYVLLRYLMPSRPAGRDMVSRVVQSLTSSAGDDDVPTISVSVFKMRHQVNEYLRRKEIRRVLSRLPVDYIGENFIAIVTSDVMSTMAETARDLLMSHTQAQWLYVISDTDARGEDLPSLINALYEGKNVAFVYNQTDDRSDCQYGTLCYCHEMLNAFVSALDAAVQEEFDVAAQVSDEEWEAIRPTKIQRRDMLLKHMQQHIKSKSVCGNCSTWRALAGDTWGATYRDYADPDGRIAADSRKGGENDTEPGVIEKIKLLDVGYWRPVDGVRRSDELFPHVEHGFRGRALPIVTYHVGILIRAFVMENLRIAEVEKVYSRIGPIVIKLGSDDGIPRKSRGTLKYYRHVYEFEFFCVRKSSSYAPELMMEAFTVKSLWILLKIGIKNEITIVIESGIDMEIGNESEIRIGI